MAETDESYAAEIESEIAKLERDAERSQKSGNIEKALRLLERALAFKLEAYGPENPETASAWTSLTNNYNVYAMKHLQDEDFKASHSLLSKAKALLEVGGLAVCYGAHIDPAVGRARPMLSRMKRSEGFSLSRTTILHATTRRKTCSKVL